MRILIVLFLSTVIISCERTPAAKPPRDLTGIQFIRNGETIEIFKDGILKGEFNPRNTDSASLRTLYFINALLKEK